MNSRDVLLPLMVAFVLFWLGSIDLTKSASRYTAVKPVEPKK